METERVAKAMAEAELGVPFINLPMDWQQTWLSRANNAITAMSESSLFIDGYFSRRSHAELRETDSKISDDNMMDFNRSISRCGKCGAEYPSARAGSIHKCGQCSGGRCSPVQSRRPTHYVLPRGTNSMVKEGRFFEEQVKTWGNDGWKQWIPVYVVGEDTIERARELAAHMKPVDDHWKVLEPYLATTYAMNPDCDAYRACQGKWRSPIA